MTRLFQLVSNLSTILTRSQICSLQRRVAVQGKAKAGMQRSLLLGLSGCVFGQRQDTERCLSVNIEHIVQGRKIRYVLSAALL